MRDKIYALLVEKCEGTECDCDADMSCEECKGPIADAILALEVEGKRICEYGVLDRPATIADLIEVK